MSAQNFVHRDLRNRSFRGQSLRGADFTGADIRGCDFSQAQLMGARFEAVRAGQSRKQRLGWVGLSAGTIVLVGYAVAKLIFGALGQTPWDTAWPYIVFLCVVMMLVGATVAVKAIAGIKSLLGRRAEAVSGVLSGAVVGFFHAGSATDNHPQAALAGAIVGGLIVLAVRCWQRTEAIAIATTAATAGVTYGVFFFLGVRAIALLSVQNLGWGIPLSLVALTYLRLTQLAFSLLVREIRQAPGTSFKGANLTGAQFNGALLFNTDFSQTINPPRELW